MEQIEPTASLGRLFVDERNGYVGICKTKRYNPRKCTWIKITLMENPCLCCIKPRAGWNNKVLVDCEFVCDVPSRGLHIKETVKSRIYCKHRTYTQNSHYEEWEEPGTVSIMRGILTQTYLNVVQSEIRKWADQLHFLEDSLKEQALCAMMLPKEYTREELDRRFAALSKAFRPDEGGTEECVRTLNKYYEVLR